MTDDKSERITIGERRTFRKKITEDDVRTFAVISGDDNPVHLDNEFALKTRFQGRIVHGILVASLISAAIGKFPGIVIYVSQELRFLIPVKIGDEIEATAEVVEKVDEPNRLILKTVCTNEGGEVVIDGEAVIKVMKADD